MWKAVSLFCYGFSILFYKPCSCYPAEKLKHTLVSIALISYICSQIFVFSFQWLPSSKLPSKVSLSFKGWSIVFEGKEQASWLKVTEGPWVGESGTPDFRKFSADSSCRCYPVCGCFIPVQNPSAASGILEQSSAVSIFKMVVVYPEPLGVLSCLSDHYEIWDNGSIHLQSV